MATVGVLQSPCQWAEMSLEADLADARDGGSVDLAAFRNGVSGAYTDPEERLVLCPLASGCTRSRVGPHGISSSCFTDTGMKWAEFPTGVSRIDQPRRPTRRTRRMEHASVRECRQANRPPTLGCWREVRHRVLALRRWLHGFVGFRSFRSVPSAQAMALVIARLKGVATRRRSRGPISSGGGGDGRRTPSWALLLSRSLAGEDDVTRARIRCAGGRH
jgi:hypothetical protein